MSYIFACAAAVVFISLTHSAFFEAVFDSNYFTKFFQNGANAIWQATLLLY